MSTGGPTAARGTFPYAHPTVEEVRRAQTLPIGSPIRARFVDTARIRAMHILQERHASPQARDVPAPVSSKAGAGSFSEEVA